MASPYFSPFKLNDLMASNVSVNEDDVLNVKQRLHASGHYEMPSYGMTRYPDNRLFDGIKSFQKENNLTVDGYMRPNGETEKALNKAIAERPRPDPTTERREAVIAFAGKYGMPEDKAREYMAKPSIFKGSRQQPSPASPQLAQDTSPQPKSQTRIPSQPTQPVAPLPLPLPSSTLSTMPTLKTKPLTERVRERADSRRPTMPDAFINSLVDDDFMDGVPDIKRDIVKRNMNDWRQAQIERWKTGTPLTTDYALRTTLGFEGVMKPTNLDPKNKTATAGGGVTDGTLKLFQAYAKKSDVEHNNNPIKIAARNRLRDVNIETVEYPRQLNVAQATAFAKSYHDDIMHRIGGHEAVELINNRQAAAAFLDTLYRHGEPNGTQALQRAINRLRPNTVKEDGILGETTFEAYRTLADKPEDWEKLSAHLYDERIADRKRINPLVDPGDVVRFRFFVAPPRQPKR